MRKSSPRADVKLCSRCGSLKPRCDFYCRKHSRDGLQSECKACAKERDRKRYADADSSRHANAGRWATENPEKRAAQAKARRVADRERMDAVSRQWAAANRPRVNERARARYADNREAAIERSKRWQRENPRRHAARSAARRALLLGAIDPSDDAAGTAAAMTALRGLPCAYCGGTERIEIDHIVPLTRGGTHTASNFAPACKTCNTSKGNRLLGEWTPPNPPTAPNGAPRRRAEWLK